MASGENGDAADPGEATALRVAAGAATRRDSSSVESPYRAFTTIRIHGWMQHWYFSVPASSTSSG